MAKDLGGFGNGGSYFIITGEEAGPRSNKMGGYEMSLMEKHTPLLILLTLSQ